MPSLRPAKIAGLVILVLLVVSNLILPAGAHVTGSLPHLQGHLDPRYINVDEKAADSDLLDGQDSTAFLGANAKAADADLLDGQDSTAFLGANAKAADADLLDGQNSTAFMAGPGKVVDGAIVIQPGSSDSLIIEAGFFAIRYSCPQDFFTQNGEILFDNLTTDTVEVFEDDGSVNPGIAEVPGGDSIFAIAVRFADYHMFQVHSPTQGMATIHVMNQHTHQAACQVQAQAVISS
jgi:hypothetical protein